MTMKKLAFLMAFFGVLLVPFVLSTPAQAQASRTWVSGVGDDANPCSRTAPCKTFAGAISKTSPGGEIDCLDPGGFGDVTITKSITIDCGAGQVGSILAAGTNGINVSAAATDIVRIRNLSIQGITTGSTGILGTSMGALYVENVVITGFNTGYAEGIRFQPTNASSIMDHNGISTTTGGGIVVVPSTGSANVQITNTKLVDNSVGLNLVSSGGMFVAVQGGMVATNDGDGIRAVATAVLNLTITGTSIVNNFGTGVLASGAAATVRIGGATISDNTTGVRFAGATMQSFKNNRIAGNNTDGTPIPAFPGPGGTALQ
jgi:Periplasmic copper-binding protein (NosD)